MIRTREEAIKQCEEFIKYHSDWSVEVEWANGVDYVLEDYKRLIKQEPCEDAISRQALLDATVNKNSIWNKITDSKGENLEVIISNLPSVTPQPRKGHWVHGEYCSECGCDVPAYIIDWKWQKDTDAKYCPNCGAKMESEGEI